MENADLRSDQGLDRRLGHRLKAARLDRDLTLDALAQRTDVSRAMISRIERGESSPTAALLDRLCAGLGVTLSSLFHEERPGGPVARLAEQPIWRDPASGYVRRSVSPPGTGSRVEIVEVAMPPGARVLLDGPRSIHRLDQQVWVLEGEIELTLGETPHRLKPGDCLHMLLDGPIAYHNPGLTPARYAVVLTPNDAFSSGR